jgi:hypothetical protein
VNVPSVLHLLFQTRSYGTALQVAPSHWYIPHIIFALQLSDGQELPYDWLIIALGAQVGGLADVNDSSG